MNVQDLVTSSMTIASLEKVTKNTTTTTSLPRRPEIWKRSIRSRREVCLTDEDCNNGNCEVKGTRTFCKCKESWRGRFCDRTKED